MISSSVYRLPFISRPPVSQFSGNSLACCGYPGGVKVILPALLNPSTTGPLVREAQRHLAQWQLQPIANIIGQEASAKLGQPISLDVTQPLQAFDARGRARTVAAIVQALAEAKESGLSPEQTQTALELVNSSTEND